MKRYLIDYVKAPMFKLKICPKLLRQLLFRHGSKTSQNPALATTFLEKFSGVLFAVTTHNLNGTASMSVHDVRGA